MLSREHDGEEFIDKWLASAKGKRNVEFCYYSALNNSNKYRKNQLSFGFVRLKGNKKRWLMVSAARITKVVPGGICAVELLDEYQPLLGRLIVHINYRDRYGNWLTNLSNYINEAYVLEYLPDELIEDRFEGFDSISYAFNDLKDCFEHKKHPTLYKALEKIKVIYCLTNKENGMLYIGSAYGIEGAKQRWMNYITDQTGGNREFIKLKEEKGEKYFVNNFQFTVLEYFGMNTADDFILKRERYWKNVFYSRERGYNDN